MSDIYYKCTLNYPIGRYTYTRDEYKKMGIDIIDCEIHYLEKHICRMSGFYNDSEEYFFNKRVVFWIVPVISENSNIIKKGNITYDFYAYLLDKCRAFMRDRIIENLGTYIQSKAIFR